MIRVDSSKEYLVNSRFFELGGIVEVILTRLAYFLLGCGFR